MPDHDHWAGFADFVAFERAAGGPSPNLALIQAAAEALGADSRWRRSWLAGCYAAVYNTPGSALLWEVFRPKFCAEHPDEVAHWLTARKPGVPIHSNRRRTHGSLPKLADGLQALAVFALVDAFESGDDYDRLWAQVSAVPAVGRYFGIKLAGTLYRLGLTEARQYDIRARGAKNGRKTLALLFPEEAGVLDLKRGGNSTRAVELSEVRAREVKEWLLEQGLDVDWFQLEALLCEYNQMVKGHRYPGSTSDGDFEAYLKVVDYFSADGLAPGAQAVWAARQSVLPPELWATRKDRNMLPIYAEHGYVWSDAVYDRAASTDLEHPVVRSHPTTDWTPRTRPDGRSE